MVRRLLFVSIACALGLLACEPNGSVINIYSRPEDSLRLPSRLIFSTVNEEARSAEVVEVKNVGSKTLDVTGMGISGGQAANFRIPASQGRSFSLAPGASTTVGIEYRPRNAGLSVATLHVDSNDGVQPRDTVELRGLDALDYEGSGEPTRGAIVRAVGYGTDVGTGRPMTAAPVGDEVLSPYWRRAGGGPVQFIPLARYSGRTATTCCSAGWYPKGGGRQQLMGFPGGTDPSGGQNQRLLPANTGTTSFSTDAVFGLYAGSQEYSDDARNGGAHQMRFFPAEDAGGRAIPNTWVVAHDLGATSDENKNYDYNDFIFLLVNALPA